MPPITTPVKRLTSRATPPPDPASPSVFSSAELIDALRRRLRRSLRPDTPVGEFPTGWSEWFAAMRERVGRVTGATADAVMAIMLAREPALSAGVAASLNRWQSFATLWRQDWQPASRDSRGMRLFSLLVALLVHLLLAVFLVYLAYVRLMAIPAAAAEGEDVIQVQYVGDGTPEDTGGAAVDAKALAVRQPAATARPVPTPTAVVPPQPASAPAQPQPPVPAPPVEQPLQVTETPQPDQTFVLPPPRTVDVPQPRLPTPEVSVAPREVTVVELPTPATPPTVRITPRPISGAPIDVPDLQQPTREVTVRDVPAPVARVEVPALPAPVVPDAPALTAPTKVVATRDIPLPAETPAPASAPTPAAAAPSSAPARSSAATPTPRAASGTGRTTDPRAGALPSAKRGDDWDLADRNRPGGQNGAPGGLFNADGSPRLAPGDGKVGGGLAPGTITEDFAKIDRNGTWLKRPPTDYTPTSFDKFWVPSESLLQEWVRRSIKEVLIPIPGTSKTITCSVVLLALGGSCGISDPNLQEVEATARKPPDVPFKRELQEDQGSLAKPGGTP